MRMKLVEIVHSVPGWKGNWYENGERYFVVSEPNPSVFGNDYRALDACGSVWKGHCREVRGPIAWIRCAWRSLRLKIGW